MVQLPWRAGFQGLDPLQELLAVFAPPKGRACRQQFIEDHAQAENVCPTIDQMPLTTGLLGTHVGGRTAPLEPSPNPLP